MSDETSHDERLEQAMAGEQQALLSLFAEHRGRLRRMIELRMDRRLQGRIDASDVLQEAFVDLAVQLPNYAKAPKLPFFLWLRKITGQRLIMTHRAHLGAQKRDAAMEVSLDRGSLPAASSFCLASKLVGNFTTASQAVMRAEREAKLEEVVNAMDPDDREVLAMRHFELLDNSEVATLLGISAAAAGMRHLRALRRLKAQLVQFPDLFDAGGHVASAGAGE